MREVEAILGNHGNHWFSLIFIENRGFSWFWAVPRCSHTRHNVRNDVWYVFVSPEKIIFFLWKNNFLHFWLLYSYAPSRKSRISWKSLIFIEKHRFVGFHEIRDFRDGAHLRHISRAAQSAEKYIFIKKNFFLAEQKHVTHRFWHYGGCVSTLGQLKTSNFTKSTKS